MILHWPSVMQTTLAPSAPTIVVLLITMSLCLAGLTFFVARREIHPRDTALIVAITVAVWAGVDQMIAAIVRDALGLSPLASAEFFAAMSGAAVAIARWFATPFAGEAEQVRRRFRRCILHRALRDRKHLAAYVNHLARRTAWSMAGGVAAVVILCIYLANWARMDREWMSQAQLLPTFVVGMFVAIAVAPLIALAANLNWLVEHAVAEYADGASVVCMTDVQCR